MKIKDFLKAQPGVKRNELEIFLCRVLGISRTEIILQEDRILNKDELATLKKMVDARKAGKPVAYILNEKEFYGRMFYVDGSVLIPRPETETVIDIIREIYERDFEGRKVRIIDVGTGSGCIAATLKLELKNCAGILAVDKSLEALSVAKKNAKRLGAEVEFCESNLLGAVDGDFDIIVANLPYVDTKWDWLDKTTLGFEPEIALYAENEGLQLIFELLEQAKGRAKYVILEADPCQHVKIENFARQRGFGSVKTEGFIIALKALQA